jgi:chemotaxis methyl-accepting protein methylase
LEALLDQIRRERGLDLRLYKPSFLERRLAVRLRARGCSDYTAYGKLLFRDPEEYGPLLNTLTINLTRFFRDATTFQVIEEKYLPELLKVRASSRRLRIWSAGCAAGEEPYSLAIMLCEIMGSALRRWQVEIIATDVDEDVLETARRGLYESFSFQGLAPRYETWIERYFSPGQKRQLSDEIRPMVSFQHFDLVRDPPPANLDLLLCRNVLIYFDRELQDRLYRAFHEALRTEGFLVLGKTEILPLTWSQSFVPVDLREHIYRRSVPK